eukprot:3190163-Amphidinium_carterae.1
MESTYGGATRRHGALKALHVLFRQVSKPDSDQPLCHGAWASAALRLQSTALRRTDNFGRDDDERRAMLMMTCTCSSTF